MFLCILFDQGVNDERAVVCFCVFCLTRGSMTSLQSATSGFSQLSSCSAVHSTHSLPVPGASDARGGRPVQQDTRLTLP